MEFLSDPEVWLAFLTLTVLEIVLGIDNIIFISVLTGRLPEADRARGRYYGLALAMLMRIALLLSLTWVMKLTDDLFTVFGQAISGRDMILILGGAFLIAKSTQEVHNSLEGMADEHNAAGTATFGSVLAQIGVTLIAEGFDVHVPRGYIYFAMAFSFGVEMLNIRVRKRRTAPIKLRQQIVDGAERPRDR